MAPYYDPENAASSYTLLSDQPHPAGNRRPFRVLAGVFVTAVCLVLVLLLVPAKVQNPSLVSPETLEAPSRGVSQGVSEKAFRQGGSGSKVGYPWTNSMLSWQRTSYHFQPEKNWMNDPNGLLMIKEIIGWTYSVVIDGYLSKPSAYKYPPSPTKPFTQNTTLLTRTLVVYLQIAVQNTQILRMAPTRANIIPNSNRASLFHPGVRRPTSAASLEKLYVRTKRAKCNLTHEIATMFYRLLRRITARQISRILLERDSPLDLMNDIFENGTHMLSSSEDEDDGFPDDLNEESTPFAQFDNGRNKGKAPVIRSSL